MDLVTHIEFLFPKELNIILAIGSWLEEVGSFFIFMAFKYLTIPEVQGMLACALGRAEDSKYKETQWNVMFSYQGR